MRYSLTCICGILLPWLLITFVLLSPASAAQIKLAWDSNIEPDLSGYKIYYGTSARTGTDPQSCGLCGYSTIVPVSNVTSQTVSNLISGQIYYFSVTAYDSSNNESGFSNEVSGTPKDPAQSYHYTVATNPPKFLIVIDGATYTAPKTSVGLLVLPTTSRFRHLKARQEAGMFFPPGVMVGIKTIP